MKIVSDSEIARLEELVGDKHLIHASGAEFRLLLESVRRLKEALTIARDYVRQDAQRDNEEAFTDMARIRELVGDDK